MKRVISFTLALIMMLGLSTACFADIDAGDARMVDIEPTLTRLFQDTLFESEEEWGKSGLHRALLALCIFTDCVFDDDSFNDVLAFSDLITGYVAKVGSGKETEFKVIAVSGMRYIQMSYIPYEKTAYCLVVNGVTKAELRESMKKMTDIPHWEIDVDDMGDAIDLLAAILGD